MNKKPIPKRFYVGDIIGLCSIHVVRASADSWEVYLYALLRSGKAPGDYVSMQIRVPARGGWKIGWQMTPFENRDQARFQKDRVLLEMACGAPVSVRTDIRNHNDLQKGWELLYAKRDFGWQKAAPKRFRVVAKRRKK
jgi:hypothetical protein